MGLLSEFLSKRFAPPKTVSDVQDFLEEYKISVDFIIKAGAHMWSV